jgi:hypothetical protein
VVLAERMVEATGPLVVLAAVVVLLDQQTELVDLPLVGKAMQAGMVEVQTVSDQQVLAVEVQAH